MIYFGINLYIYIYIYSTREYFAMQSVLLCWTQAKSIDHLLKIYIYQEAIL